MLYPLKFDPVYKNYLWGGRWLEKLGKKLPAGKIAESWEISGHPDGLGVVSEGPLAGRTLPDLMHAYGAALMGTALPPSAMDTFPLLVKFIDANDNLSVQVHPDDAYAAVHEQGGRGKTEMWVVLDASPGAKIVYGLKPGITRERFSQAVKQGEIGACLHEVTAKTGDVFDIPAGLVHAIGAGLVVAEIQQSSNTTYRVYDYDRTDVQGNRRPLHIDKALDVIAFDMQVSPGAAGMPVQDASGTFHTRLVANPFFEVERLQISGKFLGNLDGSRFELLIAIEGEAELFWSGNRMLFHRGESLLLPAQLGPYALEGGCMALRAWVPVA